MPSLCEASAVHSQRERELQLDRPSNGAWRAFDGATARDFAGYECADKANISNLPGFTGEQLPLLLPKHGQHVALDPHTDELTKAVRAHGAEVPGLVCGFHLVRHFLPTHGGCKWCSWPRKRTRPENHQG